MLIVSVFIMSSVMWLECFMGGCAGGGFCICWCFLNFCLEGLLVILIDYVGGVE